MAMIAIPRTSETVAVRSFLWRQSVSMSHQSRMATANICKTPKRMVMFSCFVTRVMSMANIPAMMPRFKLEREK